MGPFGNTNNKTKNKQRKTVWMKVFEYFVKGSMENKQRKTVFPTGEFGGKLRTKRKQK